MRDIIFRGKRVDRKNEWIYGGYCSKPETTYCTEEDYKRNIVNMTDWGLPDILTPYEVIPDTVGQYTRIKDRNGVKIFEGDIVAFPSRSNNEKYGVVKYSDENAKYYFEYNNICYNLDRWFSWFYGNMIEVVGNIYDNPELLRN